jgi:zinc protease
VINTIPIPYLKDNAIRKVFDNGYELIFVPKPGEVFNVSTWVKTGSIHENASNSGVSHFLEHLMFKGTERFKPGEFDKAMESMGAIINAATWKDFTYYYVTGPNGANHKNFTQALDMHADMLLFSTLPEEEVGEVHEPKSTTANKRERGVVIEEIGMRADQPWTKVYNALNHMMYPDGHPYQRDVIGTPEIIASLPRKEIMDYYHTWYSPQNLTTIVVGDFEMDWLEQEVLQAFRFQDLKRDVPPGILKDAASETLHSAENTVQITGDYQTSFFILGYHGPRPQDLESTIALDIASRVLGEGRSSRLYQAFIDGPDEPIFNTLSSGQSTFKLGNTLFIQGNLNTPDIAEALLEVKTEINQLVTTQPITQSEFDRSVKKMKAEFAETSETASGIADSIGESITVTGSLAYYTDYLSVLERITCEKVHHVVHQFLQPEKMYQASLIPSDSNH